MKKLYVLIVFLLFGGGMYAQTTLTYKVVNPRMVNDLGTNYFVFDIQVAAAAVGSFLWTGQANITFNNTTFSNVPANWVVSGGPLLAGTYGVGATPKYHSPGFTLTGAPLRLNISFLANEVSLTRPATSAFFNEILTTFQTLATVYAPINDVTGFAGINFDQLSMNGTQQYKLSASPWFANYLNPNLYDPSNFVNTYVGRIFANATWSQYNGILDWGTSYNTSIWDGTAILNSADNTPALATNLRIESGATLNIPINKQLTVSGTLTNAGTAASLVVASGGSLIESTANVAATVNRDITAWGAIPNHGWHLLSSPVAAQVIAPAFTDPTPANYDFYKWDEVTNFWLNQKVPGNNITSFVPGTGYLVAYATSIAPKVFAGPLNAANLALSGLTLSTGVNKGWNLLGNPFPSALTWGTGWTMSNINATAKIWGESGASYVDILTGGIIPAMNGFMVQTSTAPGSLTIPIAARVHSTQAWYKSSEGMLKLIAHDLDNSMEQESNIRVNENATEGFDAEYDSHFLPGYAPLFYSVAGSEQLSTNTLPAIEDSRVIPMGFVKNAGNNFSIELKENSLNGVSTVFLTDNKNGTVTNLSTIPIYTFTSVAGDNTNRFKISFVDSPTSITNPNVAVDFKIRAENGVITILQTRNQSGNVMISDMAGRTLASASLVAGTPLSIDMQGHTGVYIVSITTVDGVSNTKIIVK